MTTLKDLVSFVLASTFAPVLLAEAHCPSNVASLPFHSGNRDQIIVALSINHSGPYNFLLDTGTQITMIDRSLADDLHLKTEGAAMVGGVLFHRSASFAHLDLLEAGSHAVANEKVLVYPLQTLQFVVVPVRGILGEDFLEHFDMLIDNAHSILCLDDSAAMRNDIKGPRILLATLSQASDTPGPRDTLIVSARLSEWDWTLRLKLDSGANVSMLYNAPAFLGQGQLSGASWHGGGSDGAQRTFAVLPPQEVMIGSVKLPKVPFVTLADVKRDTRGADYDGLLSMKLFRRVLIDYADHFALLETW